MRASLSAGHLAVALLSLSPTVSALAWPGWLPELDTLVVRQDDSSQGDSPTATPTPAPSSSTNDEGDRATTTTGRNPSGPITTNLNTGGLSRTGTATAGNSRNVTGTSRAPKKTEYDPQDPAGSVVMVTPAPTDGFQLYKFGEWVTWGWTYTNLQGKPTGVDLYLKCSGVPQPWTLTQNLTYAANATYVWDTGAYQTSHSANPLLTEEYTLVIADADGGISATPEPGYLAPYSGFTFGLYEPQRYDDTNEGWQCASCSGAMSGLVDSRAVGVAVVMSALTVLSFTWFVAGFGAFL